MNERITKLANKTVSGNMWVDVVIPEFDKEDIFLSPMEMAAKRICEYIMLQEPIILEESSMTGFLRFEPRRGQMKNEIVGDIFRRAGHTNLNRLDEISYAQPWYNLVTFEWQHSIGDFGKIINVGIKGILKEVEVSMGKHKDDAGKIEFLKTQVLFCNTLIKFAHKCSDNAHKLAQKTENPEYRENLEKLSCALKRIPENPAESFYEAVLTVYFLYAYLPDSIGLIDRYLYPFYKNDINKGTLTDDKAKEYLQELFCLLQAKSNPISREWSRGAECHFAVGGYLENGEDGFNEFSKLIIEALMELPTWCPQVSLRWNEKTPREVLKFMMDCERKDNNKRIAFVNDEPRIRAYVEHQNLSYEDAVKYTTTGCNEVAFPGGTVWGNEKMNVLRSVVNTFSNRSEDLINATNFDEFYEIYEQELLKDLNEYKRIAVEMQKVRHRDFNIVSNFLIEGAIENGISCTQKGGVAKYTPYMNFCGLTNVYDSLSIVKQFVYDEKLISMQELVNALKADWKGYEDLHTLIIRKGRFFGNNDDNTDSIARKVLDTVYTWNDGKNYFEKKYLFGDLIGYNEHNKFYGSKTGATPDGRYAGEALKFGKGQSEGKDKNGLTALLNSISQLDKHNILTGASVTNVTVDAALVKNDDSFDKLVDLFETYFKNGGLHFQLTYVSHEDLVKARKEPEKYSSLRVRVSGFSEYFVNLNVDLQNDILLRTEHSR